MPPQEPPAGLVFASAFLRRAIGFTFRGRLDSTALSRRRIEFHGRSRLTQFRPAAIVRLVGFH